jgi:hypothetical protein
MSRVIVPSKKNAALSVSTGAEDVVGGRGQRVKRASAKVADKGELQSE